MIRRHGKARAGKVRFNPNIRLPEPNYLAVCHYTELFEDLSGMIS